MATVLLFYLVSVAIISVVQANLAASSSSECCNTCIGKTSSVPYNYDPVVFTECTKVTGGVCCFDCGSLGDPTFGDSVSFGDDGVTAVVKSGSYISFTWSGVENVTYVSLKTGQKKTVTPTSSDSAAEKKSDTFMICAKTAGTIYFRGWGSDSCREASPEHAVTVEAGDSKDTCDASDVEVATPSSSGSSKASGSSSVPADDTVESCNAQRASVQVVEGTRTCVCVSDWTNPPECDQWPVWKWLVTIGGGLATLFSIALSVRAFLQSKKKKQEEEENYQMNLNAKKHEDEPYKENLAPMGTKSDVGPMDLTPESGYHHVATTPSKEERTPGGTRKPDERLFSL